MQAKQDSRPTQAEIPHATESGRRILVERASPRSVRPALIQNGNDPTCYTEAGKEVGPT
jgi:hypothetical protein